MAQVAIRTEKLVHTYPRGNVMALKGVDLEIYVGDILSIVGQNGSGKTTLVRHFNGLLRPTSGYHRTDSGTDVASVRICISESKSSDILHNSA